MTYCHVSQQIAEHVNEPVITAPQFDAPLCFIKLMDAHKPPYARNDQVEAAAAAWLLFNEEQAVTFTSAEEARTISREELLNTLKEDADHVDAVYSLIYSDPLAVRALIEEQLDKLAIESIWEAVTDFDEALTGIAA